MIDACLAAAKAEGAVLIVDSKARGFARYGAADIVKPNAAELAHATDLPTGPTPRSRRPWPAPS